MEVFSDLTLLSAGQHNLSVPSKTVTLIILSHSNKSVLCEVAALLLKVD